MEDMMMTTTMNSLMSLIIMSIPMMISRDADNDDGEGISGGGRRTSTNAKQPAPD